MKSFYGWGKLSGYKTILRIADINKKAAKRSNFLTWKNVLIFDPLCFSKLNLF